MVVSFICFNYMSENPNQLPPQNGQKLPFLGSAQPASISDFFCPSSVLLFQLALSKRPSLFCLIHFYKRDCYDVSALAHFLILPCGHFFFTHATCLEGLWTYVTRSEKKKTYFEWRHGFLHKMLGLE